MCCPKPIVYLTTFIIPTPDSILFLFLFLLHLSRNPLLNTVQLLHPLVQSRRKPANLLPRKHTRLHPRDIRLFLDLVQRTSNKLQAVQMERHSARGIMALSLMSPTSEPSLPDARPRLSAASSPRPPSGKSSSGHLQAS